MVSWSFLSYSCTSCALAFSQLVIVLNGIATGIWPVNVKISSAPLIVSNLFLRDFFYVDKFLVLFAPYQSPSACEWCKPNFLSPPPSLLSRRHQLARQYRPLKYVLEHILRPSNLLISAGSMAEGFPDFSRAASIDPAICRAS